ncbi:hypothetical protein QOZ98_001327 [Planomicrobium stackebrandtii]|uniref:Uncharacterized protein n=1 Tax=Planomicrobium stackebrandtii TaxID=253160 RepID=A0ABU0GT24_9BACL|nr:hypothetical protein [Planomicrobium stackebrandtii]MDQ0428501.1 hypothetical protein [Planomicrobium stackebrandtii]
MDNFTWLLIIVGTILLIVMANRYFTWWAKSLAVIYYGTLTFLFIGMTRSINEKYSGIIPVPEAYWDENSQWAYTASHLFLLPFIRILFYLYYRWFTNAQSLTAIILITISLLPAAALVFFFYFIIDFGYGYRP